MPLNSHHLEEYLTYYDTFEARERAFRKATHAVFPRRHMGPAKFWQDFKQIWGQKETFEQVGKMAIVTPNPGDGLIFGTPEQELAAALGGSAKDSEKRAAKATAIAERFKLTDHLNQPLRSLSGGETVRLALAKVFAAANRANQLVMAAPFAWMDRRHYALVDKVIERYYQKGIPSQVMALTGEMETENALWPMMIGLENRAPLQFCLTTKRVAIPLANLLERIGTTPPLAIVNDIDITLKSPCLLAGDNGQGKSLLAKVLAAAIDYTGQAKITTDQGNGTVRLIFQDVVGQSLLRPWSIIRQKAPVQIELLFKKLWDKFNIYIQQTPKPEPNHTRMSPTGASLLELKLMLVATRLAHNPVAIILDEPDWGVSREAAIALVATVVNIAHTMGVAVILITHKPWWLNAVPSTLQVKKEVSPDLTENQLFQIRLKVETA